ncbi:hypothetical protein BpHYR1_019495 [Brachionus plicatilis]|uniref:Uncharacterized protein n=1 Tax=Brachionus plicatilis TaxID=10195 RepID=A0A3M7S1A1_BRAPC|nr:hypothetical protein BpHYR1_019495 [Brachionus plicatilis]
MNGQLPTLMSGLWEMFVSVSDIRDGIDAFPFFITSLRLAVDHRRVDSVEPTVVARQGNANEKRGFSFFLLRSDRS